MPRGINEAQETQEVIVVGRIGAPHGVRGDVHLHSYTSPAENLLDYQPWLSRARMPEKKAAAAWQPLICADIRPHQDHYIARVQGYEQREDVATLRGREIGVPREQFPSLDDTEHYWRDLMGSKVISTEDRLLGTVVGMLETGVHDVIRVQRAEPGLSEILIPFVKAYVLQVAPGQLTVDWDPEWIE